MERRSGSFTNVDELSDDAGPQPVPGTPPPRLQTGVGESGSKRRKLWSRKALGLACEPRRLLLPRAKFAKDFETVRQRTLTIIRRNCPCTKLKRRRNCFLPFRQPAETVKLCKLLFRLQNMDKMEMDKEAQAN